MAKKRGYKTVKIKRGRQAEITLRTSDTVKNAYDHLSNLTLFDFSRVLTLVYAAYAQGQKDGARSVFENLDSAIDTAKKAIPHKLPGRPKK